MSVQLIVALCCLAWWKHNTKNYDSPKELWKIIKNAWQCAMGCIARKHRSLAVDFLRSRIATASIKRSRCSFVGFTKSAQAQQGTKLSNRKVQSAGCGMMTSSFQTKTDLNCPTMPDPDPIFMPLFRQSCI